MDIYILLSLVFPSSVSAYYTNMSASVVVGQSDFTSNVNLNPGLNTIGGADRGVFVDPKGRLIVSDSTRNRIMIWNTIPSSNGISADLVLGQINSTSVLANQGGSVAANTLSNPWNTFSDGNKLVVTDAGNNRVLIWNSFPTQNGQSADVVVGNSNFTSVASAACNSSTFDFPTSASIYNGKLLINILSQNRILVWNSTPTVNGVAANLVVGQPDLTTCSSATTNKTLSGPRYIQTDPFGRLVVADRDNNRVLIWNSVPTTNFVPADVVVGQSDFSSLETGVAANRFTHVGGIFSNGNRLFISDDKARVLIFNSVPSNNNAYADVVLGQVNFTNGSANGGGSGQANNFSASLALNLFEYQNKLFVLDEGDFRLLIFNNIISSPQMNISLPLTPLSDGTGRIRVYGNVQLGERPNYSLQWVKAEVNGEGLGYVTNLSGGRDNGTNQTLYDFYHDFNPGSVVNSDSNNFTLKLVASSFNADTTSLFYFTPFILGSVSNNNFSFSVNKYQIQRIKDNIDHFEVWVHSSTGGGSTWTRYISGIPTSLIDTNTGNVTLTGSTPGISFPNVVTPGIYDIKIKAISKNSGWGEDSNTLSGISLTGTGTGTNTSVTQGLVLQINSIDGNTDILSTFNPSNIKTNYGVTTLTPGVSGISWAGSLISLNITNKNNTNEFKTYTTKVNPDSSFTMTPSLYTNSILNFTVTKDGMYNFIPSFNVTNQ